MSTVHSADEQPRYYTNHARQNPPGQNVSRIKQTALTESSNNLNRVHQDANSNMPKHDGPTSTAPASVQNGFCGVGIILTRSESDVVHVQSLTPGGSAQIQNVVRVGDRLLAAQGLDVGRMSDEKLRDLVLGEPGSTVYFTLRRRE
jgi:C-terminal processing protease CtpA/Prc